MANTTLVMLIVAGVALVLDLVVHSGGILSGVAAALLIERGLDAAGVAAAVRWPLAGLGLAAVVATAVRFGERVSERLFPARARTNLDRMVGLVGRVHSVQGDLFVVDLEGDLWSSRLESGAAPTPGDRVRVVAFVDQVPVVRREEGPT